MMKTTRFNKAKHSVERIVAGMLQVGDLVTEDDPGVPFPDGYDFRYCEWDRVTLIPSRYADYITVEFTDEDGNVRRRSGSTDAYILRRGVKNKQA